MAGEGPARPRGGQGEHGGPDARASARQTRAHLRTLAGEGAAAGAGGDPAATRIEAPGGAAPEGGPAPSVPDFERAPDALLGQVLGGCRLDAVLGKGGMAVVYRAKQLDLDRDVAVKVLAPRLTRDKQQVEQFAREARTIARLEHPNVVGIHAFGQEQGLCFLVAPLLAGGSLRGVLQKKGRLPPPLASAYVAQMAKGLQAAHAQGIIHRDVKPDNALLSGDLTVKVADFGLARMSGDPTQAFDQGVVVGTPHYMSPEQVDATDVDARTDIYALGATFYHLLVGEPPFAAGTTFELLLKHVNEPLVPPHVRAPGVPEGLSKIVCKMMAKRADERYADLAAVLADLARPAEVAAREAGPGEAARAAELATPLLACTVPLPPLRFVPARRARPVGAWATVAALLGVAGLGVGAGAGPIGVVLASLSAADGEADPAAAAAHAADEVALARLRAEVAGLPDAERAARLEAFAAERAGSPAAAAARAAAAEARGRAAEAAWAAFLDARGAVLARRDAGEPGPALDLLAALPLDALSEEQRARAEVAELPRLRAALEGALAERGVVWVAPGPFVAGEGEGRREATTPGLYVDRGEVTRRAWAAWLAEDPARPAPPGWPGRAPPPGTEAHPVTGVSLQQAQAFAAARGRRVPTALEWEKAARGVDGRTWPWGEDPDPGACVWGGAGRAALGPAGRAPRDRSPWGCLDMAGNAAELVLGPLDADGAPSARVAGGGWASRHLALTRAAYVQDGLAADAGHEAVGVRLVADALPPPLEAP